MAVFAGGCSLEAIEAVCNGDGALPDVLAGVAALCDQSLLQREQGAGSEPRFGLLRVIREYALEVLVESGEVGAMRRHHAHYFLALAEQAEPELLGAEQQRWMERLAVEYDNLRAALEVCTTSPMADGEPASGLRLAGALWRFWEVRGYLSEGRLWLERTLVNAPTRTRERAKAAVAAGRLAAIQGDHEGARRFYEESLSIYRHFEDQRGIAFSLNCLGNLAFNQGDFEAARRYQSESLALFRECGDKWGIGAALNNLGLVAVEQGNFEAAYQLQTESLAVKRAAGDQQGIASSLNNLGNVALYRGDYEAARRLHAESLAIKRELGDKQGIASIPSLAGGTSTKN